MSSDMSEQAGTAKKTAVGPGDSRRVGALLGKYGLYVAFIMLTAALASVSPPFLTASNIINILRQTSINGIIAVGMTFVIITGGIDLSVGSLVALSAVVATSFAHPGEYPLILEQFDLCSRHKCAG